MQAPAAPPKPQRPKQPLVALVLAIILGPLGVIYVSAPATLILVAASVVLPDVLGQVPPEVYAAHLSQMAAHLPSGLPAERLVELLPRLVAWLLVWVASVTTAVLLALRHQRRRIFPIA